jgi:hypothetical protein
MTAKDETDALIKRIDTIIKSVDKTPTSAVHRLVSDLEASVNRIEGTLRTAWTYCGKHPQNSGAFDRYVEVLRCYERGATAVTRYRSGHSSHGNVA